MLDGPHAEPCHAPFPDGMPPLQFERAAPAGIQAYAALRQVIVTLNLRPGQSFSAQEIAQLLRTGRTPVRRRSSSSPRTG